MIKDIKDLKIGKEYYTISQTSEGIEIYKTCIIGIEDTMITYYENNILIDNFFEDEYFYLSEESARIAAIILQENLYDTKKQVIENLQNEIDNMNNITIIDNNIDLFKTLCYYFRDIFDMDLDTNDYKKYKKITLKEGFIFELSKNESSIYVVFKTPEAEYCLSVTLETVKEFETLCCLFYNRLQLTDNIKIYTKED